MQLENILNTQEISTLLSDISNQGLNVEKFKDLLNTKLISVNESRFANNDRLKAYTYKIIENILTDYKDLLIVKTKTINIIHLQQRLDDSGYKGSPTNIFLLENIIAHAINEFPISREELQIAIDETYNACIEKTYKAFIQRLIEHPVIKAKVSLPLPILIKQAQESARKWQKLIDELEESEVIDNIKGN